MKKKVMLHYCDFGVNRSPAIEFDAIRNNIRLNDEFDFVILNQVGLPGSRGVFSTIRDLYRQIKESSPDIIHISGIHEGFYCMIAAVLAGCHKRILITHGIASLAEKVPLFKHLIYRFITEPITLMLSTFVQCNSEFSLSQKLVQRYAKRKSTVIYNFLNIYNVDHTFPFRKKNEIEPNEKLICVIANVTLDKGFDIISETVKLIKENVRVVIIGDGDYSLKFKTDMSSYIENKKVLLLGKLKHEDAMQILSESDVFFLPTRRETFGMVFAEAGFYGIPVVASSVGGVGEIVVDGKTGFLVNSNDLYGYIYALRKLLNDEILRQEFCKNAIERIDRMLSSDSIANQIAGLYKKNDE